MENTDGGAPRECWLGVACVSLHGDIHWYKPALKEGKTELESNQSLFGFRQKFMLCDPIINISHHLFSLGLCLILLL